MTDIGAVEIIAPMPLFSLAFQASLESLCRLKQNEEDIENLGMGAPPTTHAACFDKTHFDFAQEIPTCPVCVGNVGFTAILDPAQRMNRAAPSKAAKTRRVEIR